ncbi:MAG: hypothetical protein ACPG4E_03290 [Flavobacteriaceae bacterium]
MRKLFLNLLPLLLIACSKPAIPEPEQATLLAPDNLNSCTTAFSVNSTQSQVNFRWSSALHTDQYTLVVRNIDTNQEVKENTALTTLNQVLEKGFAYQWWVVSSSEQSLTQVRSEAWQFYLEGSVSGQHLPFATRLINPLNDQSLSTGSVEFSWEGNDLDGGALRYTVFLGTSLENLTSVAEKISTNTHVETLEEGVYFWKVTTYDSDGNSGSSVTYRFQVRD